MSDDDLKKKAHKPSSPKAHASTKSAAVSGRKTPIQKEAATTFQNKKPVATKPAEPKKAATSKAAENSNTPATAQVKSQTKKPAGNNSAPAKQQAGKPAKKPAVKTVLDDSGLEETVDLNAQDMPDHPIRIWPD